jgi:N-acetyl-anhydromuramyl-L-alanine amidase AmpD
MNYNAVREERLGVMLHYDGSTSDAGAVQWLLRDSRCKVSYNWLVLDSGEVVEIAPPDARAWHAGVCRPSHPTLRYRDANSAFYGLSLAATVGQTATSEAKAAIVDLCRVLFIRHGWDPEREGWRIVGHETEAWPRGRKIDPTGPNPSHPVLEVEEVRELLRQLARVPPLP